ncbi:hypothetical protein F5J12DRAFT_778549 [Pisolithus orientalis]|uniref:uncharacterized protein n=1 Tax=Pisolithus orientalis TaxID=936130 RepID=UPI0022256453|nr:uncharacterized protein F5J12DRAFT_778549 [Pisolithus orientalis]KAI6034932.1 hypothetical protein F5J12DRAFT_778549 [Pisolithus orientalis]
MYPSSTPQRQPSGPANHPGFNTHNTNDNGAPHVWGCSSYNRNEFRGRQDELPSQPSLLDDSSSEFSDFHQGITFSHGCPKNTSFHPTTPMYTDSRGAPLQQGSFEHHGNMPHSESGPPFEEFQSSWQQKNWTPYQSQLMPHGQTSTSRSVSSGSLQYGTPTPDMAGIQNGSSELRALSETVGQQSVTIEKLTTHLQTVEEEVAILHAWMETQQDDRLESSRGRRAMKPLDTCEPFEQIDQKTCVWHPNFLGQVDDAQNAKFIQEVAQCIWDDETTWHQQTGKGKLPDSDYSSSSSDSVSSGSDDGTCSKVG